MQTDNNSHPFSSLAPVYQQVLRNQVIGMDEPGTVLRDFNTLLSFISTDGTQVSGKTHLLPLKQLAPLNERLRSRIEIGLSRPVQKSYPHINGLYLLLRTTGVGYIEATGQKQRLCLDQEMVRSWQSLNPTECYFTLLEAWLLRGRPEIIAEPRSWLDAPLAKWEDFFKRIPPQGLKLSADKREAERLPYVQGLYTVALLELFGLISIRHAKPEKGQGWRIDEVHKTSFGEALLKLLYPLLVSGEYFSKFDYAMEGTLGELQPTFQPFFPEWRKNLSASAPATQDGIYIFKVSLGRTWRRIAIPGKMNFESLANSILDAFDFDHDHLYCFTYKNRFGVSVDINHPYMDDPPWASEVAIMDLLIKPGTALTYLYDFGDNWEFSLTLERIDPVDKKIKKAILLDARGKAPAQYPDWDE